MPRASSRHMLGLLLALLAVTAQQAWVSAISPAEVSFATVAALCHHDDGTDRKPGPVHPPADCVLCCVCSHAASVAGPLATPPALLPPAEAIVARAAVPPPATAPPSSVILAAHPRGPPVPA